MADVLVPDGVPLPVALDRTTTLGVGAHPDDLEFFAITPIAAAFGRDDAWFTGITCTDGAGSARAGRFAACTDAEMIAIRRDEQVAAARIGGYSAIVQLGYSSVMVCDPVEAGRLVDELVDLLDATRPAAVYTHNLADKHSTHLAVGAAVVRAVRRLPTEARPGRLLGCESWRDLDWMPDHEKVLLDTTGHGALAARLAAVFESQIEGAKRYDRAAEGRRRANATMQEPRALDTSEEVVVAMDLTPLVEDDDLDPVAYVVGAVDRFRSEVTAALGPLFPGR